MCGLSDELTNSYSWANVFNTLNPGTWLDQEGSAEVGWTESDVMTFKGRAIPNALFSIRITNKIIEFVPTSEKLTDAEKDILMGQAYFLRAWYYFQVIKRWGGMPLFDKSYTPNDDLDMERLTYQESHEWVIEGLNQAIELLPEQWPEDEKGRATKTAAMAVRSMAELYAASPLMQNDLNTISDNGYNIERCKTAARYANEVIKKVQNDGIYRLMDKEEYEHIFYSAPQFVSDEAIWYRNNTNGNRETDMRIFWITQRFAGGTGNWAWASANPTANIVETYEVINPVDGKAYPQSDARSGYDPQKPFENRDPRFYNNIIVPGQPYGLNKSGAQQYFEHWIPGAAGTSKGKDIYNDWYRNSLTGLRCNKFSWPSANQWQKGYKDYYYSSVYIRVAQLYLDYAEAMNEAYGPTSDPEGYGMTAVDAINMVRNRVGMVDVLNEFSASKEVFRDRIRNERAVELYVENHRWWDIRRWMIAEEVLQKPIQGYKVELMAAGANPSEHEFRYTVQDVPTATRVFESKHYWYPIPKSHQEQYFNFKQNPGW